MTDHPATTNSQKISIRPAQRPREMRAGALTIVQMSTGAGAAPEDGSARDRRHDGRAPLPRPTPTVSIVEVVALTERETTRDRSPRFMEEDRGPRR